MTEFISLNIVFQRIGIHGKHHPVQIVLVFGCKLGHIHFLELLLHVSLEVGYFAGSVPAGKLLGRVEQVIRYVVYRIYLVA